MVPLQFYCLFFQIMSFISVAFSATVLLLLTEHAHARPAIMATPTYISTTPVGCEYHGQQYQPGQVIYRDKCSETVCTDSGGVIIYDKPCAFGTTPAPTSPTTKYPISKPYGQLED